MSSPDAVWQRAEHPPPRSQLPLRLASPLTELGPDGPDVPCVHLDASEIRDIDEALAAFKALEIDGQDIGADNFVLPSRTKEKLLKASLDVHAYSGVSIVKGLDPARYSDADNLLLFLGLSHFIGDKHGIQDKKGNVRQVAAQGGATLVSSAWRIYNDLMAERPDVVQTLMEPNWPIHMSDRKSRYVLAPLWAFADEKLLVSLDPSRLGAHPAIKMRRAGRGGDRSGSVPALTAAQTEALRVVSAAAQRHSVVLSTQPGDLVFVNNWAVLHSRHAYVDAATGDGSAVSELSDVSAASAASASASASAPVSTSDVIDAPRRHLLRLWLRSSALGWTIPESLRAPWESAFGYTDEGYISGDHDQLAAQLKYAVVPEPSYKPARYTTGSAAFVIENSESESESEGEGESDGDNGC